MKNSGTNRTRARALATEFLKKGNPTGWFEVLYQEAETRSDTTEIPWADGLSNPDLLAFWRNHPSQPQTNPLSSLAAASAMTPSNSPAGASELRPSIFLKPPSAPHENDSPNRRSTMSPLTYLPRHQIGQANSISSSKRIRCKPCRVSCARWQSQKSRNSSRPAASYW